MEHQQKKTKQATNLIEHYQTTIEYHLRQREYYQLKSRKKSLNKSKK